MSRIPCQIDSSATRFGWGMINWQTEAFSILSRIVGSATARLDDTSDRQFLSSVLLRPFYWPLSFLVIPGPKISCCCFCVFISIIAQYPHMDQELCNYRYFRSMVATSGTFSIPLRIDHHAANDMYAKLRLVQAFSIL